jgi:hypothetical protein
LARLTGYKISTVDSVLWRACADGILDSRKYMLEGWDAAFADTLQQTAPTALN